MRASLVAQTVKESAWNVGDLDSIPQLGKSPGEGNGNPFQYSCLENSMDREPGGQQSTGLQRVDWVTNTSLQNSLWCYSTQCSEASPCLFCPLAGPFLCGDLLGGLPPAPKGPQDVQEKTCRKTAPCFPPMGAMTAPHRLHLHPPSQVCKKCHLSSLFSVNQPDFD